MVVAPTRASNDFIEPFLCLHTLLSFGVGCKFLLAFILVFHSLPALLHLEGRGVQARRAQAQEVKVDGGRRQGNEYAGHFQEFGDKASVPTGATDPSPARAAAIPSPTGSFV